MARKIPASLTSAYNRAIKRQGGAAERAVKAALREFMAENPDAGTDELREYAIELMRAAVDLYGNACSQAALDLQDEIAREFGTRPPDVGGWLYEPDEESMAKTAHYHAGKLSDGDADGFVREIASAARFYAERGANATMVETAKSQDRSGKRSSRKGARTHGVTFARVPQGATTCSFCAMLASRGFVYLTEESAGEFDKFHKHCDCRIVPGYPGMELEGYDPDLYYDMWKHPEKYELKSDEGTQSQEVNALEYRTPSLSVKLPDYSLLSGKQYSRLTDNEKEGFDRLAELKHDVTVLPNIRSASANIDMIMDGEYWELKTPTKDGGRLKTRIGEGVSKWERLRNDDVEGLGTPKIVVDNRFCSMTDKEVIHVISECMNEFRENDFNEAMIIRKNGRTSRIKK